MQQVKVLDHGYVTLVETWGSEERIIEAARMSTNKGFQGWGDDLMLECPEHGQLESDYRKGDIAIFASGECICMKCHKIVTKTAKRGTGDERLLRYLYTHGHMTPFEMSGMTIEVQAPIFVFREWHRHRTQSYNELSARYTPLPDVNYVPSEERLLMNGGKNKQAGGTGTKLTPEHAMMFQGSLITAYEYAQELYEGALKDGVPKELARLILPVGRYSRMRASANLRNWLGFLALRLDSSAQWEIRQYAEAVGGLIADAFPQTWKLFKEPR